MRVAASPRVPTWPALVALAACLAAAPAARSGVEAEPELRVRPVAPSSAALTKAATWEDALARSLGTARRLAGLRFGLAAGMVATPEPAAPASPSEANAGSGLFAQVTDHRLDLRPIGDDRSARLETGQGSLEDWSGYEPRLRRAGDTMAESVRALEWPDVEGGSEPWVPASPTTPDGRRSGLGLGWRF